MVLKLCKPKRPKFSYVTRWHKDEYAAGSYSYFSSKSKPVHMDVLSSTVNNCLYFAGEATNRTHPASTHGAVLSGQREAFKIAECYAKQMNL